MAARPGCSCTLPCQPPGHHRHLLVQRRRGVLLEQEDVRELGADEYQLWRTVVPVLGLCSAPILCQLPPTEVTDYEDRPVQNGSIRGTWRFTHVAIQEYVLREQTELFRLNPV